MVKKEEFYYDSADKKTKIHAIKWYPENKKIIAIIQISHGMLEFIDRYDEFAKVLAEKGYLVVGNDHLGHGNSILTEWDMGFFCEEKGNQVVLEDIYKLMEIMKKEHPNVTYLVLGHSMGSFLIRQFITIYSEEVQGAIIVGTGYQPYALVKAGQLITSLMAIFKGWRYRSKFVNNLAIGNNNKKFEPSRTSCDWLSRDEKIVDAYVNDQRINFVFTLNAFYNMFKGILYLYKKENLKHMIRDLPILILSGEEDPVGDFGKAAVKVYDSFKKLGMNKVSMKLYEGARHEVLNEINRNKVYEDILKWVQNAIY